MGSQVEFRFSFQFRENLKGLNLRRAADGTELHAVFAAVSLRLNRIPAMIKLKMLLRQRIKTVTHVVELLKLRGESQSKT
jgi:hypothetical protein